MNQDEGDIEAEEDAQDSEHHLWLCGVEHRAK